METLQHTWQFAVIALMGVWVWVRRHQDRLLDLARDVVGAVEKYKAGASEAEMEAEAVAIIREQWREYDRYAWAASYMIKWAVAKACEKRKAVAVKAGLR